VRILNLLILLIGFLMFNTCTYLSGDKNLGTGYYYAEDGSFSCIIYSTTKPYKGAGLGVIPYEVTKFTCNKKYIIAMTLDDNNVVKSYWIIDKSKEINLHDCHDQKSCDSLLTSNVTGPIDSISFYNQLKERNISLKF